MDRISYLPIEVISFILSFLPTIEVIRTSVLSSRWRCHWTSVYSIDVSTPQIDGYPPAPRSLINSIDGMLRGADTSLEAFRFQSSYDFNRCCVAEWIIQAIRRGVCELDVSFRRMRLPSNFFCCSTLTVLKLGPNGPAFYPRVPNSVCFPNLKRLQILMSGLPDDLTRNLFSRCPVLEDLVIRGRMRGGSVFNISSSSLKRLIVEINGWVNFTGRVMVFLSTPNLEFLHLRDASAIDCVVEEVPSPTEISLEFIDCCERPDEQDDSDRAFRLLTAISGGRMISLDAGATYFISGFFDFVMPMFYHLTHLEMTIPISVIWNSLLDILWHSPILRVLTLIKLCDHYEAYLGTVEVEDDNGLVGEEDFYDEVFHWREPEGAPECLTSHLEVIKVRGFVGEALLLTRYLLKNGQALRRLEVENHHLNQQQRARQRQKILGMPRASTDCEIQFVEIFPQN